MCLFFVLCLFVSKEGKRKKEHQVESREVEKIGEELWEEKT